MLSFWEQNSWLEYDHIIVGSGIVGLSTAISLKEKNPDSNILILERGLFPTGASTKNAGFACFGSVSELMDDLENLSKGNMQELVALRWAGLQKLRQRLGDEAIGFQQHGGYELIFEENSPILDHIEQINELLRPVFGFSQHEKVFEIRDELISAFQFNPKKVKHLIFNHLEAQIDTGRMMQALLQQAQRLGIVVLTGANVDNYVDNSKNVGIFVDNSSLSASKAKESVVFTTKKLILCTNAFSKKLLPTVDLEPGRGQVLVTKPIPNLPFKGTFHYESGYYYFRNYGNRIIFGGGRNLDKAGETTNEIALNSEIQAVLEEHLKEFILPDHSFEVEHRWAGIMAFGNVKEPIVKKITDNIYIGVRLGGMGVAIGTKVGEELSDMVTFP